MTWLTSRLVADWRAFWRRYSVRLAAATATLTGIILGNREFVVSLLSFLPDAGFARVLAAVCVGIVVFVVPTLAVLWRQEPPNG